MDLVGRHRHTAARAQYPRLPAEVEIIDCTLRDGEQAAGVAFSVAEKVELARAMAAAGIRVLDAGFPAAGAADRDAMQAIGDLGLPLRLAATARPLAGDIAAAAEARAAEVFVFLPTSDFRLEQTLGWSRRQAETRLMAAAEDALGRGMDLNLVFEDATRADPLWISKVVMEVHRRFPVRRAVLADTVGCATPDSITRLFEAVAERIDDSVGLCGHCHNDFGLAAANTMATVAAGARSVTCTVNGIGERAGNADLAETVAGLTHLYGVAHGVDPWALPGLASAVERMSGIHLSALKPVTGSNVFRHESGVHVDGMLKDRRSYQFLPPEWVGRGSDYVLGKHSGLAGVLALARRQGGDLGEDDARRLLADIKTGMETRDKSLHTVAYRRHVETRDRLLAGVGVEALPGAVRVPPAAAAAGPPRTLVEKVVDGHSLDRRADGPFRHVAVDAVLGHDATVALLADEFDRRGLTIWDAGKVLFTNDHFSPPATCERADISRRFLDFSRRQGVRHLMLDKGICHQLLVENPLCLPGGLIVGADSHTVMAGALGACATGMGSTDILYTLATGTTWLRVPETIKVSFVGRLPPACCGRDVVLELLRRLGEDGARYGCLEFHDRAQPPLPQDDRFAIANMAVEMGAKFGVFVPDAVTLAYLHARDGGAPADLMLPDPGAAYHAEVEVDLAALTPRVARPYSPANVVGMAELEDIPITMAFLGSCSSGRLSDLRVAAEELAGRRVHPDVRFVVIPASAAVFRQALDAGYVDALTAAGATFNQSSCGPCGGIDKGVLGQADVCVSTSNRNFRGRMGHWDSRTYLASARTVARAAVRGTLGAGLYGGSARP